MPAGIVPCEIVSVLRIVYLTTFAPSTLNWLIILAPAAGTPAVPELELSEVSPPKTISPIAAPETVNVPVVIFDPLVIESRS